MLPTKTFSKILREKLLIQNSHSNRRITSFDVLITTHVNRPKCRTFCCLCSLGNELKKFSRVQRRKYDTIVNITSINKQLVYVEIHGEINPESKWKFGQRWALSCNFRWANVGWRSKTISTLLIQKTLAQHVGQTLAQQVGQTLVLC